MHFIMRLGWILFLSMLFLLAWGQEKSAARQQLKDLSKLAGCYSRLEEDGKQTALQLNANGTFEQTSYEAGSTVRLHESGTWRLQEKRLVLMPAALPGKPYRKDGHILDIVTWGSRQYLLEPDGYLDFLAAIQLGNEPRSSALSGSAFLRYPDHLNRVSGLPRVPSEWNVLLHSQPFTGHVLKVVLTGQQKLEDGKRGEIVAVTIDGGKNKGLRVGMQLVLGRSPDNHEKVQSVGTVALIQKVEAKQCIAEFTLSSSMPPTSVGAFATTDLRRAWRHRLPLDEDDPPITIRPPKDDGRKILQ